MNWVQSQDNLVLRSSISRGVVPARGDRAAIALGMTCGLELLSIMDDETHGDVQY